MNTKILFFALIAVSLIVACNSAKKTQETVVEGTEKVVEEVKEVVEKVTTTQNSENTTTQKSDKMEENKEADMKKGDETKSKPEIQTQTAEMFLGEYEWIKTYCCGRMRNTYEPKPGTSRSLTITQKMIKDTGGEKAAAYEKEYSIDSSNQMFPNEHLLKVGNSPAALLKLTGDTLLVDRGYIDLERTWWVRKK